MPPFKCSKCGGSLGKIMKLCPHCGHEHTEDELLAFADNAKKFKRECGVGCLGLFILCFILAVVSSCWESNDSVHDDLSLEHKLAVINAEHYVEADDSSVKEFTSLLEQLSVKTGYSRQRVADIVLQGQMMLEDRYNLKVSLLDFMHESNKAIQGAEILNIKFEDIVASLVMMLGNQ